MVIQQRPLCRAVLGAGAVIGTEFPYSSTAIPPGI